MVNLKEDSLDPDWEEAFEDLDDGWKLNAEMKNALHQSSWLGTELQDEGLRHLLVQIVSASRNTTRHGGTQTEQEILFQNMKDSNPAFATFLDKAMVVAGALERQGTDADCHLEEWLQSKSEGPLNVTLKPLLRRQPAFQPVQTAKLAKETMIGEDEMNNSDESVSSSDDGGSSDGSSSSSSDDGSSSEED